MRENNGNRCGVAAVLAVAMLLGGCGSGGLTTASLLPGGGPAPEATAAAAPVPEAPLDPLARPVHVATTSAQAVKCGFFFDQQKLRSSLLAAEAQSGSAEQAGKAEKAYDNAFRLLSDKLRGAEDFCTEARTAEIKTRLQRHLAGDFTPPVAAKPKAEDSWFFLPPNNVGPLDREKIFDPGPRGRS